MYFFTNPFIWFSFHDCRKSSHPSHWIFNRHSEFTFKHHMPKFYYYILNLFVNNNFESTPKFGSLLYFYSCWFPFFYRRQQSIFRWYWYISHLPMLQELTFFQNQSFNLCLHTFFHNQVISRIHKHDPERTCKPWWRINYSNCKVFNIFFAACNPIKIIASHWMLVQQFNFFYTWNWKIT